jgi:transposase
MVFFVFVLWMMLGVVGVRPRRDFEALEERRKKAARLFARGRSQADVARELEVSRQSASRWYAEWSTKGTGALSKAGRAGRLAKLSPAQLRRVAAELEKGPLAHGYPTDLWTLARVGEVIERTTGVSYHPGHVWKVLREQLGWSRQRPARRAVERDDEAMLSAARFDHQ